MKKLPLLLVAILALAFTSCVEEDVSIQRDTEFELPENPIDLSRADANILVGEKFGMADITLSTGSDQVNFSMMGCELSVLEAGSASAPAASRIDEAGSTFAFGNTIVADPLSADHNLITFSKLSSTTNNGDWSWFLENSVFPIVGDAPLKVSRIGDDVMISCTDCPMEYEGRTYVNRRVVLSLVD